MSQTFYIGTVPLAPESAVTAPGYRSAAWRLIGQKEAMSAEEREQLMEEKSRDRFVPEPRQWGDE